MGDQLLVAAMLLSSGVFVYFGIWRPKREADEIRQDHRKQLREEVINEMKNCYEAHRLLLEPDVSLRILELDCEAELDQCRTSQEIVNVGIAYMRLIESSLAVSRAKGEGGWRN